MERRTVLATLGIGLTTTAAGCLNQIGTDEQPQTGSEADESDLTTVHSGESIERSVGDGTLDDGGLRTPHLVTLTNTTADPWEAALVIEQDDEPLLEESFELEADADVRVRVTDLHEYAVEATVRESDETESIEIDRAQFDCNGTTVSIGIDDDGTLSSSTLSTMMACVGVETERVGRDETVSYAINEPDSDDPETDTRALVASNPTEEPWTTRLVVDIDDSPRFDGVFALEPGASADILLGRSDDYTVTGTVLETGVDERLTLGPDDFDCNAASTEFTLTDDGEFETSSTSTLIACDTADDE